METCLIGQNVIMFLNECWQWNSFPTNFKCYASKMTRKFDKIYFDILACGWIERNGKKRD